MKVTNIDIRNFRPYNNLSVDFDDYLNLIVGSNATGKTSIVESIYMLGITKSHRALKEDEVIKKGEEFTRVCGKVECKDRTNRMDLLISSKGKRAAINKVEQRKLSEYIGELNVVMFSPEDLNLIKGAPKDRRRFIDLELGQASKPYLRHSLEYKAILKQRNELLKKLDPSKKDDLMLDVLTEQLVVVSAKIVDLRTRFISRLNDVVQKIYIKISNGKEKLTVKYKPSISGDMQAMLEEMRGKYVLDLSNKTTMYGPHRDDIEFYINDMDASVYGSQGQQRGIVLAIKLALVNLIYQIKGEFPILILDDALSELDLDRQYKLIEYIDSKIQTFITATEVDYIEAKIKGSFKVIDTMKF